jgi:hypothetical protein
MSVSWSPLSLIFSPPLLATPSLSPAHSQTPVVMLAARFAFALCAFLPLVSGRQLPARLRRQTAIDPARIPEFGVTTGVRASGSAE